MSQITVKNLKKTYKVAKRQSGLLHSIRNFFHREYTQIHALDDISFTIHSGELVGYIGPNGAGKSTTVKVMSGILVPDSGICEINGFIPWKDRIPHVNRIGVVFGQRSQLWWDVPVIDSFELLKDIYKISKKDYEKTLQNLVSSLSLEDLLDVPVRQLSLGQRMRCELAASLLHNPSILFLDEPTIGLDAISKLAVRDFIKKLNEENGTTIILTTHDMDDIEALCSRIIVIGKGKILFDGDIGSLRSLVSDERRLIVDFDIIPTNLGIVDATIKSIEGHRMTLAFNPSKITGAQIISNISSKYPIKDVFIENAPIEEIIADLYEVLQL